MMNRSLNKTVHQALKDVDVILFMIGPGVLDEIDSKILKMIPEVTPIVLAINKVDLLKEKSKLLGFIKELDAIDRFKAIVPISVKKSNNLEPLKHALKSFLPEQEFIFSKDELTDKNERFLSAEIVREKVFRLTGQELPYSIAVEIEKFEIIEGVRRIFAAIILDRDAHKPMIIGKKGKRFSLPNSRIMVHQPSAGFQGQATDIEIHANEVLSLKKRLNEIYSKHTGKSVDEVKSALERDNFMTAEVAKDFGLIDEVVEKRS